MKKQGDLKICVGASAGGHFNELEEILKRSGKWPKGLFYCVTTQEELVPYLERYGATYVIGECNRLTLVKMLTVFMRAFWVVAKIKPDVVITTGALPLAWVCLENYSARKLFGSTASRTLKNSQ